MEFWSKRAGTLEPWDIGKLEDKGRNDGSTAGVLECWSNGMRGNGTTG